MKKLVDPGRKHHFFKVLLEEDETRMRIPKAFYPRISRESQSCERAVVKGPSGAHWVAKVNKSQNGIFLERGWEVFVRENGLQKHDFLVFRYDGSMQFSVKVFNMYGVPREECFTPVRCSPLAEERIRRGRSSCCPPVGTPRTSLNSRERRFVEQRRRQDRDESDEDEVLKKTSILSSSRKKRSQSIDAKEYVALANEIEHRFESRSSSPFFRVIVQPAYLKCNYLYLLNVQPIPLATRKAYFPNHLKNVLVKDFDGRSWKLRILRSETDMRLSKGVIDFIKKKNGMNLKLGDVCIFEIVEKRSYQLVLQVHVFRRVPVLDDDSDENSDDSDE